MTAANRRLNAVLTCCSVLALAVLGRAAYLQLVPNTRLEQMSRRQFQSKVLAKPRRGTISDRNGEPLAVNIETESLAANPSKIRNSRTMARLLSKVFDLPYVKLLQKLEEKREFVWIKRHMSDSDEARLKKWRILNADGDLAPGFWLVRESQRRYPHGELASHVVGDVDVDSDGVEGVEYLMNDRLGGHSVSVSAIQDALGRPSFIDTVAADHMRDGEPVSLTLDASLQFAVEHELNEAVAKTGSRGGNVIVMNAVNGEILAMANSPTFNPNNGGPADLRRNRGVTDGYEPGSTLKAVLAAGVLSNGGKLSDKVWGERGSYRLQGKVISEAEAKEKFEWLTLKEVIQHSSNIGAAKFALKLGADRYMNTIHAFGFGERTGIGFPGEIPGRLPAGKKWQPLTLANVGFGQGILVTPLQITRAYAAFLNGGWLVQPTLLRSGDKMAAPRRILTQNVADEVIQALAAVTGEKGTGVKAALPGYSVAGKTGTAQVVDPETGRYSRTRYVASFVGFALNVEPRLVIFTALQDPKGIHFGAETAAPFFREVLNDTVNRFGMPSVQLANQFADAVHVSQAHGSRITGTEAVTAALKKDDEKLKWNGATPSGAFAWKMPRLTGLSAREALRAVSGRDFRIEIRGSGLIQKQVPEEGQNIVEGEVVRLTLSE